MDRHSCWRTIQSVGRRSGKEDGDSSAPFVLEGPAPLPAPPPTGRPDTPSRSLSSRLPGRSGDNSVKQTPIGANADRSNSISAFLGRGPLSNSLTASQNLRMVTVYCSRNIKIAEALSYQVTVTDDGQWLHAPGSNFAFAYLGKTWDSDTHKVMTTAFQDALRMSSTIKDKVKAIDGGPGIAKGVYLINEAAMTQAMNSIDGMGETTANDKSNSGKQTIVEINKEFFAAILAGLTGDITPMLDFLTKEMGNLQAQVKEETVTDVFGTVIALISLMPELNVPVTTFQYVFSSSTTASWFVSLWPCTTVEKHSYDYKYRIVEYNYVSRTPDPSM